MFNRTIINKFVFKKSNVHILYNKNNSFVTKTVHKIIDKQIINDNFNYKISYNNNYNISDLNLLQRNYCKLTNSCWNCKNLIDENDRFFCKHCGSLREVHNSDDYFKLLGIERKFNINIAQLTKRFREMQSQVHPDKFGTKSNFEQNMSVEWSSLLNKAYKTLSVPVDRGQYILMKSGINFPKDNTISDPIFLSEMIDRNEEVDEAKTYNEIINLLDKIRKDIQALVNELDVQLENNNIEDARDIIVKMKYFLSIEKTLKDKSLQLNVSGT